MAKPLFPEELFAAASDSPLLDRAQELEVVTPGPVPIQRVRTQYVTAVAVQQPRDLVRFERELKREAEVMGEDAYYSWTTQDKQTGKKSLIKGPSVDLCLAAMNLYRNCVLEQDPTVETSTAWIFTSHFVDLESGVTKSRQFRQSRGRRVYGRIGDTDPERAEEIRFAVGQSKSSRNVIYDGVGRWRLDRAVDQAMLGVRIAVERFIHENGEKGMALAQARIIEALQTLGVTEAMVLEKCERPMRAALTVEDIVVLRGDYNALKQGRETIYTLYSMPEAAPEGAKETKLAEELAKARGAGGPPAAAKKIMEEKKPAERMEDEERKGIKEG